MILFHGSKANFTRFDIQYVFTGEGVGIKSGFMFTESLKGACDHATNHLRHREGEPLLYVCEIPDPAMLLRVGESIQTHPASVLKKWKSTPFARDIPVNDPFWIYRLQSHLIERFHRLQRASGDSEKLSFNELDAVYTWLGQQGFPAIDRVEFMSDEYLDGSVILVTNFNDLTILERHPARTLQSEYKKGRELRYKHAEEKAPLGDTGVLSCLRQR